MNWYKYSKKSEYLMTQEEWLSDRVTVKSPAIYASGICEWQDIYR